MTGSWVGLVVAQVRQANHCPARVICLWLCMECRFVGWQGHCKNTSEAEGSLLAAFCYSLLLLSRSRRYSASASSHIPIAGQNYTF